MTSSQPVVTPNALNFTPDNIRCYAYSGEQAITDTEAIMIEFKTNSEYIVGTVQFNLLQDTADDMFYRIKINDQTINGYLVVGAQQSTDSNNPMPVLIPPFSSVVLTADNVGSSTGRTNTCSFVGKAYGMTETGFQ